MKQNVQLFFKALAADGNLREKLEGSAKKHLDKNLTRAEKLSAYHKDVLFAAETAGFGFTIEELRAYEQSLKVSAAPNGEKAAGCPDKSKNCASCPEYPCE